MDYLYRCILDYPDIETGGQLFGYWTAEGVPVVMYVIGPGPQANHQITFFNQDVNYLVAVGRCLKERYGLHHIGEWHSHHHLGLAKPSGHDSNTMNTTIREKGLGRFLLCIGNLNGSTPSVGAFLCDGMTCTQTKWATIAPDSPLRARIDSDLQDVLEHPRTVSSGFDESTGREPTYAPGYWLSKRGAGMILNDIITYLKGRNRGAEVRPLLNERGEVLIHLEYGRRAESILFPLGFPTKAPLLRRYKDGIQIGVDSNASWNLLDSGILYSFICYYESI